MNIAILAGCAAVAFALAAPAPILVITNARIIDGTGPPAVAIANNRNLGTLEPGKIANLVIVDGDPLQDVCNATHAALAVKDGKVVSDHLGQHH